MRLAVARLVSAGLVGLRLGRIYTTPCFPAGAGPDYVNAAAAGPVPEGWDARRILDLLHRVEADFGRTRETRWGMRTLDLDLLAVGGQVLPDAAVQDAWRDLDPAAQRLRAPDRLILPHPRMQDRAFVLVPLADVAPGWRHPRLGLTVAEMLARLPPDECRAIVPMDG
ncbi:MAG: 2-amino-4-hydroxy-6-hydroxymethyldihydropteridine diphosphokinase [Pseudomonadota bacterium]